MRRIIMVTRTCAVVALVLGLAACGGKPAPTAAPAAEADALVAKFKEVADAAQQDKYRQADVGQLAKISDSLAALGPGGIDKLLDLMAMPDVHPRTKMFVTMNVKDRVMKENLPRLLELTQPTYEINTRVNAAHLVASYNEPLLVPRSLELLNDPEPRVRMASFQVLLLRGAPEALALVEKNWSAADTPAADKAQIVNGIPESEAPKYLSIYLAAAGDVTFDTVVRGRAISMLTRNGDASALPVLDKIITNPQDDPSMQMEARMAADALRSRLGLPLADTPAPPVPAPPAAAPAQPAS